MFRGRGNIGLRSEGRATGLWLFIYEAELFFAGSDPHAKEATLGAGLG